MHYSQLGIYIDYMGTKAIIITFVKRKKPVETGAFIIINN